MLRRAARPLLRHLGTSGRRVNRGETDTRGRDGSRDDYRANSGLLCALHLRLRLHLRGRGRPSGCGRARPLASHGQGALRQGAGGAGAGLSRGPPAAPLAPREPEGLAGRVGAHRLGRGARRNCPASQAARRRARAGECGVRHHHTVGHRHSGRIPLDRAPAPCLRQPQRALRHGDLQLPPRRHLRAHLRRRHADAGFPERRLHRPLGAQPEHHLARLRQPGRRGQGARRQAHRRRSAPRRPRGQGGCVAARQARQRRGARLGPRQPAPGSRALRHSLHAGLDQWPAARARRRRHPAPRRPPACGR